jgi:hypothetical protein
LHGEELHTYQGAELVEHSASNTHAREMMEMMEEMGNDN